MLASSWGDPVIGLDIHWEMVPTPAPTPLPIPNPFTGIVFDPVGLAVGLAITNAVNAVTGAPAAGPVLLWGVPVTNTGTEAKHVPGHILIPPGTAWAPVPKTPRPVIRPGETPKPPNPVKPEDDAMCVFGSKTVSVMGSNAVRFGDILLSCSEPVRLPSSVVMAVPKGAPILIGGPPSLDIMSAIFASLRTRFVSDSLHAALSRMQPSRFRNMLSRLVCFFTGHPVDVATGRVMTDAVDAELPGRVPLRVERVYSSAFASRDGPLGHGWSLSLDQAVWEERGRVVLLAEDGRELEFDTFDLPGHRAGAHDALWHPVERLTLRRRAAGGWEVEAPDGTVREYAAVAGRADGRAVLQRLRSRDGSHEVSFRYDRRGRLEWVRDAGGRLVNLEHDDRGRVVALRLPAAPGGASVHRRYEYDAEGDLVRVTDARGASWRYEYVTHLLTAEWDRAGLGFYFAYDGMGEDAWCVRTWGDGGIYDHAIAYDKQNHATFVTDSLGHTTSYRMNLVGLVTQIVDPLGGETRYEYDDVTLQRTAEVDALGNATRFSYDGRGRRTRVEHADGTTATVAYDPGLGLPVHAVDGNGGEWQWRYDGHGRPLLRVDPLGYRTSYTWEWGRLRRVASPGGSHVAVDYDERGSAARVTTAPSREVGVTRDAWGRVVRLVNARGGVERRAYDPEGVLVRVEEVDGTTRHLEYDAGGRLVRTSDGRREMTFTYVGRNRLRERRDGGAAVRFHYDTEERVVAVENEAGERYEFVRNACGDVVEERGFDGAVTRYRRDRARRVDGVTHPSGRTTELRRDALGRVTEQRHSDGTFERYAYAGDGALVEATNANAEVHLERDLLGRVVRERTTLHDGTSWWVASSYDADGRRVRVQSSGGPTHRIERDAGGRVRRVALEGVRGAVAFEHDAAGAELSRVFASGVATRWERDAAGRAVRRTTTAGHTLGDQQYVWDRSGELRAIIDGDHGDAQFLHDGRGRLVAGTFAGGRVQDRAMDPVGNVYRAPDRSDRRYGRGGRIEEAGDTRFIHDPDGNLVERLDGSGRQTRYVWAGGGKLQRVDLPDGREVRFAYDALARRVSKRVYERPDGVPRLAREIRWQWDGYFPVVTQDSLGEDTTWIAEPDTVTPLFKVSGGRAWGVLTDAVGVPTELVSDGGRIVERRRLDLYGAPLGEPSTIPFVFAGQWRDEETSLAYNVFRYYSPELGRYISPDPLGIRAGLRRYGYVQSPVTHADPLGLIDPWDILFTQTSISDRFLQGDWAGRTLEEAIAETRRLGSLPEGLELNVMRLNDEWVALNNRTLFVAQEANLPNVRVNDVGPGGMNQVNKLLNGGMPLPAGEQPEVKPSCT